MKRLELINGKFNLEGKVINAEPVSLAVIELKLEYLTSSEITSIEGLSTEEVRRIADRIDREKEELEKLHKGKPKEANAYTLGYPYIEYSTGFGSFPGGERYRYPILYLKIKENKK